MKRKTVLKRKYYAWNILREWRKNSKTIFYYGIKNYCGWKQRENVAKVFWTVLSHPNKNHHKPNVFSLWCVWAALLSLSLFFLCGVVVVPEFQLNLLTFNLPFFQTFSFFPTLHFTTFSSFSFFYIVSVLLTENLGMMMMRWWRVMMGGRI